MKDHLKEREIIDVAKKKFAVWLQKQVAAGEACRRNGVWGNQPALRHCDIDQEVFTKLMTLCKRRYTDTFPPVAGNDRVSVKPGVYPALT